MVLTTPNNTTLVKSLSASVPQPEVVCCPLESYRYSILSYAISKVIRIYLLGDAPVCNPRKWDFVWDYVWYLLCVLCKVT